MKLIETDAIVRIAYSKRLDATVFRHTAQTYFLEDETTRLEHTLNRYMLHIRDAFYSPSDQFVMDRNTKSVIATDMMMTQTNVALRGFGEIVDLRSDGRHRVRFTDTGNVVNGPAICVSPWRTFSNHILHVLLGIMHCDDILDHVLPVLVPEDLSEREASALRLIGVEEDRLIRVPRTGATHVTDAFVPSKSFARSPNIFRENGNVELGYFIEPNDLKAYNKRVRSGLVPRNGGNRVVLIARADAGGRHITNETKLAAALKRFDTRYIVTTETSIVEVSQAIINADIVIAPHGAGLLNLFVANADTTLIEIDHPANDWLGPGICRVLGCKYHLASRADYRPRSRDDLEPRLVDIDEMVDLVESELKHHDEA